MKTILTTIYTISITLLLINNNISAQQTSCTSDQSFSNNIYTSCNTLPYLSASLHWIYHQSNSTVDIAYRAAQSSDGWVAWAINPTSSGMIGAQAFLAFHDSSTQAVTVITTQFFNTTPVVVDEKLSFTVYSKEAVFSNGEYTIFASLELPSNSSKQSIVWQSSKSFQNGLPYSHPMSPSNLQSTSNLDFASGDSVLVGSGNSVLHRKNIHGVLNTISWGILMPIGIIIARYMKVFEAADPAWFYLHVICQLSAYVLGVSGWGLGLKLGSESVGITYHKHRIIGIVIFSLATLQVFALLMRPTKDHKYRLYWNIYHWFVGYSVMILGIVNIFKGFDILLPAAKWKHAYIGVIVILAFIALILEVFTWAVVLKRKRSSSSAESYNGANGFGAGKHEGV